MRRLPKGFNWNVPVTPGRKSLADKGNNFIMCLQKKGCKNRPFFHIIVTKTTYPKKINLSYNTIADWVTPHEQVGTYDPMVNRYGEKLCALNIERINYYLSQGIEISDDLGQLLGLAGLLPQHPLLYQNAWRNRWELEREDLKKQVEQLEEESEEAK